MMAEELELQVPDEDDNPWFDGGVTFCSFVVFGTIPSWISMLLCGWI